jgi:hypothetical protein
MQFVNEQKKMAYSHKTLYLELEYIISLDKKLNKILICL